MSDNMIKRYDGSDTMGYGMRFYDISKLLKERRLENGWSMATLGRKIGVSSATIHSWEHGYKAPTLDRLLWWAESLGLQFEMVEISRSTKKVSGRTKV